ncbi:MAG: hypothetical protein HY727_05480 [Candidatus Rokubacteria bacterium]|nr:hypothetical protein [Candidatus Rokubacteria bacterium]
MGRGRASQPKRGVSRYWWLAVPAVVLGVGLALALRSEAPRGDGGGAVAANPAPSGAAVVQAVGRRETRPTLDPARFVGRAALAHQVAREIPDVLDQLYCYCECDKHLGHKSLLSCYTDGHAAT